MNYIRTISINLIKKSKPHNVTPYKFEFNQIKNFNTRSIFLNSNKPFDFQNDPNQSEKSLDNVIDKVLVEEKIESQKLNPVKEEILENEESKTKLEETEESEKVDFWFEETQDEAFVPLWQRLGKDRASDIVEPGKLTPQVLEQFLNHQRAIDVKVIDMKEKCDWAETIVVCSVTSSRHLMNLAERLRKFIKQCQPHDTSIPLKFEIEGDIRDEWLVIDLQNIVIHLFMPKTREIYDIEGLWEFIKRNPTDPKSLQEGNFTITETDSSDSSDIQVTLDDPKMQKILSDMRDQFVQENRIQEEKDESK